MVLPGWSDYWPKPGGLKLEVHAPWASGEEAQPWGLCAHQELEEALLCKTPGSGWYQAPWDTSRGQAVVTDAGGSLPGRPRPKQANAISMNSSFPKWMPKIAQLDIKLLNWI
jgi:hypothetical protein